MHGDIKEVIYSRNGIPQAMLLITSLIIVIYYLNNTGNYANYNYSF